MKYNVLVHSYLDPWTYVKIREEVLVKGRPRGFTGEGFARRRAEDKPNEQVGFELALIRARENVRRKKKEAAL